MPTPRKSRAELALSGTLQRNPKRYATTNRQDPTSIQVLGRPPGHLQAKERSAWSEIARNAPPGLLTKSDRMSVELAVTLLMRIRAGTAKASEVTALASILSKLGCSPLDRQRMNVESVRKAATTAEDEAWAGL